MKVIITKRDDVDYDAQKSEVYVEQSKIFDPKKCIKIWNDVYNINELQEAINAIQRFNYNN